MVENLQGINILPLKCTTEFISQYPPTYSSCGKVKQSRWFAPSVRISRPDSGLVVGVVLEVVKGETLVEDRVAREVVDGEMAVGEPLARLVQPNTLSKEEENVKLSLDS